MCVRVCVYVCVCLQERDAAREETAHRAQELATTNALLNTTRASLDEQRGALNKLLDSENTRREEVRGSQHTSQVTGHINHSCAV